MSGRKFPVRAAQGRQKTLVLLALTASQWLREEAQVRGWRLLNILYGGEEFPRELSPSGALVNYLPGDKTIAQMRKHGCVAVRLGSLPHPGDSDLPAVLPDRRAAGELATEHFCERGFTHVGFYGSDPWGEARHEYEGLERKASELGMQCHLGRFKRLRGEHSSTRVDRRIADFTAWIRDVPKPLGLLVAGSSRAVAQCSWIDRAGISIPDDVAVLCSRDNADVFETVATTISSIDMDDERRMRTACELLDKLMSGEAAPQTPIMIPPKGVIERESTDILATSDRLVADVLRFIWDNLEKDLSVDQIADEADISSRQLSNRFRKALGRTVTQELLRKRLQEMKLLLRTTDGPVRELAPQVGFRSIHYMNRTFRAAFGMTPLEYRKKHR